MTEAALPRVDTRSRVLAVALDLIAEKGYAATTTRELSERLGFTKAALYYHFHTKEDLLVALVEPAVAELRELVNMPARDGDEGRHDFLAAYVDLLLRHVEITRVLSQDRAVSASARLQAMNRPLYQALIERLTGQPTPDTTTMARVALALGGMRAAVVYLAPDADLEELRAGLLTAACGALGIAPSS